jgi:hypothetical protein
MMVGSRVSSAALRGRMTCGTHGRIFDGQACGAGCQQRQTRLAEPLGGHMIEGGGGVWVFVCDLAHLHHVEDALHGHEAVGVVDLPPHGRQMSGHHDQCLTRE